MGLKTNLTSLFCRLLSNLSNDMSPLCCRSFSGKFLMLMQSSAPRIMNPPETDFQNNPLFRQSLSEILFSLNRCEFFWFLILSELILTSFLSPRCKRSFLGFYFQGHFSPTFFARCGISYFILQKTRQTPSNIIPFHPFHLHYISGKYIYTYFKRRAL